MTLRVGPPHHVAVKVRDLEAAERFYGGVLGLPVLRRWTSADGQPRSIWFDLAGAGFLAVEKADPARAADPPRHDDAPGWHLLALTIPAAEREAWRARVAVERETSYTLYTRDPDGNWLALSHHPYSASGAADSADSADKPPMSRRCPR